MGKAEGHKTPKRQNAKTPKKKPPPTMNIGFEWYDSPLLQAFPTVATLLQQSILVLVIGM